jgi:hypothetical protein
MLCAFFFWCCLLTFHCVVWGSFESLVVHLREKETIRIAKAMLQRVHLLCTLRHGSPPRALAPENVNVRVFLAGFMIAFRPTHVFESMGVLEGALLNAATPLMEKFQGIIHCLLGQASTTTSTAQPQHFSEIRHALTDGFPFMLFDYLVRFKAWKASYHWPCVSLCASDHSYAGARRTEAHRSHQARADGAVRGRAPFASG